MNHHQPQLSPLLNDPYLEPYRSVLQQRARTARQLEERLAQGLPNLAEFACAHEFYGLHRTVEGWVFREFAPHATGLWLVGDFSDWQLQEEFKARRVDDRGVWELELPPERLQHGQYYRLEMVWPEGRDERLPAYVRRVVQDPQSLVFRAQVWEPPEPYVWRNPDFRVPERAPLIYEAHIGMAQEEPKVGSYDEFRRLILPRIAAAGYNTIQLMAIMEHPYYGSFGYQVSNFFAASSRFGTPHELKALIDDAHGLGIAVIMDIVHSHAVRNEQEGLSLFDGTPYLYFHDGSRGWHHVWDTRCFDYGKIDTLHLLLSNCRYWLDEFRFDGFRFDGVTSMLYLHHGLGVDFLDYAQYFDSTVDNAALTYLTLANTLIHHLRPDAITIAEDVSGMPGLAAPRDGSGGVGFDYRLAMGVPECWLKLLRDVRDEDWNLGYLWYELTNRRSDEQTVNYVESHDQALVGGKTMFFEMADADVYTAMHTTAENLRIDRAVALHKLIRLATIATAGHGYLNFMGNEFGHPEWIDFPREGNAFSYSHARRQWSLRDNPELRFYGLAEFDAAMMKLFRDTDALQQGKPILFASDDESKILALMRGSLLLVFNFHSTRSHVDFPLTVVPGEYDLLLDSDATIFAGQGRIEAGQRYFALPERVGDEQQFRLHLYLPARVALVLQRRSG